MALPFWAPENSSHESDAIMHWSISQSFQTLLVILFSLSFWDSYHHILCHILGSYAVSVTKFIFLSLHEAWLHHSRVSWHIVLVSGFELLSGFFSFYFRNDASSSTIPKPVSWAMLLGSGFFTSLNSWSFRVNEQSSFSVDLPGN